MNTKTPRYYLGLDKKPTYQDANYYRDGNTIIGVRIKVDGKQQFIPCDNYTLMDIEEHDKAIRQEFWDILKDSLCGMDLKDYLDCYADKSTPYFTATDLFYKLSPEEVVEKFKAWKEKNEANEAAKKREAERKIRDDIMEEMIRISQPVKDMGWSVKVQFFKDDEGDKEYGRS